MKNRYKCDVECIDHAAVSKVKPRMLGDGLLFKTAENFQLLGDSTRIKLLHALSHHELCVCDLAYLLSMSQSAISHQLRLLRESNLVKFRRQGKIAYYSLSDRHIINVLEMGVKHALE
ncbi:MAG: metalloregulator ArsR/SmtB family transcription factor [Candidatus Anstonellaceae archaeon]